MLDNIIAFSIKNKLIIGIFTLALIIWGIWSANKLPIDAVPDITNNQVQIITTCPTLAGQEVEQLVTYPIEQSIANLPDLVELRSISRFGLSVITVVFEDKVDIYFARQLINERLIEAQTRIPEGLGTPELAPVSTGLGEVYQYIIHPRKGSESKYSSMDLRTMQDWIVARQLYGIPGIAEVNSFGGKLKQYEVAINPDRLVAMGVSIPDIFTALENNNENTGGAYIDKKPNAYFIRGVGLIRSFDDIKSIVVKTNPNGTPILIKDVAEVQFGSAVSYGAMTYNGEVDAVGGIVMMLKGANSASVVANIKEKMINIQKALPKDVIIEPFLDRTDLIKRAISTVETNLIEGALIVIFVLVLFLGNLRAGLIVASAIPLSMLFALSMMKIFGISANLMSLGAIDFGLIVDGAVIIVEATLHHLGLRKSMGKLSQSEMDKEVFQSASKIRGSAAFGEIIILIVYIPILSLVGIEGKMFGPMAQTVGFAIFGALILSMTYIPMMCALFLSKNKITKTSFSDKLMKVFHNAYEPLLKKALAAKKFVIAISLIIFIIAITVFFRIGGEFIPNLQEGDYAFHCILPQGTSLSQSLETSMQASRLIKQFDEVKMVVGKTGSAEVPTDPMPPEASDVMIILKDAKEWKRNITYDELGDEILEELSVIPGVFFEKNQPIQMRFNELMTGIRQDVAVKIFGENMDTLLSYANEVKKIIEKVPGTTEPSVERVAGLPQIVINYNRSQIANYGLNIEDINHIVSTAFAGGKAGVVFENERKFDLVVRLDSLHRHQMEDVSHLYIPVPNGNQIPLSQVAEIKMELGPSQISREDGKRRIVIGFNISGRDVETVVRDIDKLLEQKIKLPEGYYYSYGGTFENLKAASDRLMVAVPLALVLIFILLYFTFKSISQASLIFTAIPMAAIGGVFALLIRDMPFSISAGVGFIALFGVAVLNGIVLIGTFNELEKEGVKDIYQRIMEGTKIRLRPVLMTATVASLGFLPMALSHGAGAEVQKPLATVVIGGLITATLLTLFVLPLLYLIFSKKIPLKKPIIKALVFFLLIGCFNKGTAQSKTLTLNEAINIALKNNSKLQSNNLNIQASENLKHSAFELPKTNFNFQYGQYNSINNDQAFQISQNIPFPTYFSARSKLLEAELVRDQLELQISESEIKYQIQYWYNNLAYLKEVNKELHALDSLYVDFVRISGVRYKAGETDNLEKLTAQIKRDQFNFLIQQNEKELKSAYLSLRSLLNIKVDFDIAGENNFHEINLINSIDTTLITNAPSLKLMKQKTMIAAQNRNVESAANLPEFNVGYFNQTLVGTQTINNTDVYFDRSKRFQGFNVGLNISLNFRSNAAKLKSLDLKQSALEKEAEHNTLQLQTELQNSILNYDQNLLQYNYYKSIALQNANVIINTAKVSYKSGEVGYQEYLQALQTAAEIKLNYLQSINQLNQSIIKINYLLSK